MSTPLKSIEGNGDIAAVMAEIGRSARAAAHVLALASTEQKNRALDRMAAAIRAQKARILAANAEDVSEARAAGVAGSFLDRLALNEARVEAIAAGIEVIRDLKDPVGVVTEAWTRPNGMLIERVRVPLGVVGIIYESRPNVTADAGTLCLKAGNAAILRGGSDFDPLEPRHSCRLAAGPARRRLARGCDPARADPRSRRRRHDVDGTRRGYRCDRSARW